MGNRRECCVDGCRGLCHRRSSRCIRHAARHMIRVREVNRVDAVVASDEEAEFDDAWRREAPQEAPPPSPITTLAEEMKIYGFRRAPWHVENVHDGYQVPFRDEHPGMPFRG